MEAAPKISTNSTSVPVVLAENSLSLGSGAEAEMVVKELEKLANEIKAIEDKMALLSEKEKATKQKEMEEKSNKLKAMGQQIALDLRKERDDKLKEILQDIEKVIQSYAQKNGYDFILNDRVLLYGVASADISQDIIDLLNAGYKPADKKK